MVMTYVKHSKKEMNVIASIHCKNIRIVLTQFGYLSCNSRVTSMHVVAGITSGQLSLVSYMGNYYLVTI